MDWEIELAKALVFPTPQAQIEDAGAIWRRLTGSDPDNLQKRGLPPPLLSVASGLYSDLVLNVVVQVGRVEVVLSAADPDPSGPAPQPLLPADQRDHFFGLMRQISDKLSTVVPSVRFAAIAQLVRETKTEGDGVALINKHVNDIFLPDSDSVLFQLNRPKQHPRNKEIQINRLCKWGVAKMMSIGFGIDGMARVLSGPPANISYRPHLHLDINNVPLAAPASEAEARQIFAFMWDEVDSLRIGGLRAL